MSSSPYINMPNLAGRQSVSYFRMLRIAFLTFLSLANCLPSGEDTKAKRSADPGIISGDIGLHAASAVPLSHGYGYGGGALLSQLVAVENNVGIPQAVGVPHPVPVGVPVGIPQPVPVDIPVEVPVVKTVSVPYEKPVPYPVVRKVPVEVVRKVPVPVPQPYPVKVPIYKTRHIYYDIRKKYHHSHW